MGKIYGYARISTPKQNLDRQIRNIAEYDASAAIFSEAYTGTKFDGRRQWSRLRKLVKAGDTIIFDSVSRMSRNAEEGCADYEALYQEGIELVFLKEPHINTSVFRAELEKVIPMTGTDIDYILDGINKYSMAVAKRQIRLAFEQAEKEVVDLRQRTREGIETARRNNKQIGQAVGSRLIVAKSFQAKSQILKHSKAFQGTLRDYECIRLVGVARNTYYKYKRELQTEIFLIEKCRRLSRESGEPAWNNIDMYKEPDADTRSLYRENLDLMRIVRCCTDCEWNLEEYVLFEARNHLYSFSNRQDILDSQAMSKKDAIRCIDFLVQNGKAAPVRTDGLNRYVPCQNCEEAVYRLSIANGHIAQ